MNNIRALGLMASLLATSFANPAETESLKPSKWLTHTELEDIHNFDEMSLEKLEEMPIEKGAKLMQKWYHLSHINHQLIPSFIPHPTKIPVYIIKSHDKKETADLTDFVETTTQDSNFGNEEVTVFITGLPSTIETVKKANHKLIHAYIERYNRKHYKSEDYKNFNEETAGHTSGEETSSEWLKRKINSGNLIVIDLGLALERFEHLSMLDVDEVGGMVGKALVNLADDCDVHQDIIHIVGQGIGAHVAGAAGDEYNRLTGHKLRRITALDPTEILPKNPQCLTGLSRGDAEFVDAIHTSVYGMGTLAPVGDIDFFPNGPCAGVPGAENVIEASMRATLYFAESVLPGNERNFPAIEANSLKQYKTNNGFGRRAFMGIATDYDLKGDYMLQVSEKSPFGKRATDHKQNSYQFAHDDWRQHKD